MLSKMCTCTVWVNVCLCHSGSWKSDLKHAEQGVNIDIAQVLEKEAAERRYEEAKQRNQTAGQVKRDPVQPKRGMELFTVNVNLAPRGVAYFTLVY